MAEIKSVKVQNYKSIKETDWIKLNENILTLVGKNEAGKSNFLEALSRFNEKREYSNDELSHYTYEKYIDTPREALPIVHVRYKDVNNDYFSSNEIEITKYGDGRRKIHPDYLSEDLLDYVKSRRRDDISDIAEKLSDLLETIDEEHMYLKRDIGRMQERLTSNRVETIRPLKSHIGRLEKDLSDEEQLKIVGDVKVLLENISMNIEYTIPNMFTNKLPSFKLFREIEELGNEAEFYNLSKKLNDGEGDEDLYNKILSFAGLSPMEIAENTPSTNQSRRNDVSQLITNLLNDYWTQHHGQFKTSLELTGGVASFHIKDGDSTEFNQPLNRSTGFRWFLSFIINVIAIYGSEAENTVILLDDPGVHLHPDAHKDLRDAFQNLAEDNKLVYSTHSPYMIDKTNLNGVRIVRRQRDEEVEYEDDPRGTVVKKLGDANSPVDDSLASVRMALGATFSDSLFASKKTILVEGHEDRLYLEGMSDLLGRQNRATLDNEATIVDCGGASKVDYLSRIVDSEEYNYTVVLDDDDAGCDAVDDLKDSDIDRGHIHLISDVMGETEGGSVTIEDMYSKELFCEIVAEIHNDDGITAREFENAYEPPNDGIVNELDNRIKEERGWTGSPSNPDNSEKNKSGILRKARVASSIYKRATNEETEELFTDETLNRFETLIEEVNASVAISDESEEPSDREEAAAVSDD